MSENTQNKDIRTFGYVLKRTNYGEADRILSIITPVGKKSVIAKGVRKSKSKLAGGVEIFTLAELNIHEGKGDIGVLIGAKMIEYFSEILKDLKKMELAGEMLKKINRASEADGEYFKIIDQALRGLNMGVNIELVESWFLMNLNREMGEEMNLYRDRFGEKLAAEKRYDWDINEKAFFENAQGGFGVDEIKVLRIITANELKVVTRVRMGKEILDKVVGLIRAADMS